LPYPSKKSDFVSWDDDIPNNIWKVIKIHVPNHQSTKKSWVEMDFTQKIVISATGNQHLMRFEQEKHGNFGFHS
jgi:hypothetical protein